jgi:hypothetical protein
MSARPIIDAGPGLNFLSINKERLLIAILGPLSAPETVSGRGAPQIAAGRSLPRCRNGMAEADASLDSDTLR